MVPVWNVAVPLCKRVLGVAWPRRCLAGVARFWRALLPLPAGKTFLPSLSPDFPMKNSSLRRGLRFLVAVAFCLLAFFAVKAVDPAPTSPVSNVTFAQRTDGSKLVDVRYTLTGGSAGIAVAYSLDGGATYSAITSATGDVGATVSSGTSKLIVWDAGTEYPNTSSANVRFRVTPLISGAGGSFAPILGGTYQMGNLGVDADTTDAGTLSTLDFYVNVVLPMRYIA
jgi:hypothetical protein